MSRRLQRVGVQGPQVVGHEEAVAADELVVEMDRSATGLGALDEDEIPVDLGAVAVVGVLVRPPRRVPALKPSRWLRRRTEMPSPLSRQRATAESMIWTLSSVESSSTWISMASRGQSSATAVSMARSTTPGSLYTGS